MPAPLKQNQTQPASNRLKGAIARRIGMAKEPEMVPGFKPRQKQPYPDMKGKPSGY